VLRYLSGCSKPALVATILGYLIRCVFFRKGEFAATGACKASWIAQTFGVSERSVKAARKELARMGWLQVEKSDHWHKQRFGGRVTVNLAWAERNREGKERSEFSPRPELSTSEFAPPESNKKLPNGSNNQKLTPEGAGVKKTEPGKANIRSVRVDDLGRLPRLEELYWRAEAMGLFRHSESQVLNFLALVVRAKDVNPRNPVRVFMALLRRNLWHYATQGHEDQARAKLNRYRGKYPDAFRVPPAVFQEAA
jgi:hypothetical protein